MLDAIESGEMRKTTVSAFSMRSASRSCEKHILKMLQDIATGGRTYIFRREVTKLCQKGLELTPKRRAEIAQLQEKEAWADVIPNLRWHDLRRTCGCRLLQDLKLSMEEVSKWLGHASIEQTEKAYAFLEVEHLREAVQVARQRRLRGSDLRSSQDGNRHVDARALPQPKELARTKAVTLDELE